MDGVLPLSPTAICGLKRPMEKLRPSGKTRFTGDPGGKQASNGKPQTQSAADPACVHVCQDRTARPDPIWDAPRVVPAFAAQLLGQMMPSAERPPAGNGYVRSTPALARLVNLSR